MAIKPTLLLLQILLLLPAVTFAAEDMVKTLEIGKPAPDFDLPGIDGKRYSLDTFKDARVLVVIFTANHCPTAQAYEDRIIQLVNDYRDKGVAVVCISSNNPDALRLDEMGYTDLGDTFEDMKIRARDKGFNFPYLYDGDEQAAGKAYGAQSTPHVFIFDEKRTLRYAGRIDDAERIEKVTTHETRDAIDAILAGQKVAVATTKTFGCSIKWAYKQASVKEATEKWQAEKVGLEMLDLSAVKALVENKTSNLRLINVWATWCGPCVAEFPQLLKIFQMYRNREFELVTLSADEPDKKEQVLKFLTKNHASGTNYLCSSDDRYQFIDAVDKAWPGALPYTLLVKPGGEIIYKKLGMIDDLELKRAIVGYLGRYYE